MFTFINSLSFPILCTFLIVIMGACLIGAYNCYRKGDKVTSIIAVVISILTIPIILFRYSQEPTAPLIIKNVGSNMLYITMAIMIIAVYIYALYRYRKCNLSEIEKQKLRITLFGLPITFLFAVIMVLILGR